MEVIAIRPRGYCYGVVNALNVVKKAKKDHPNEKVHILGIIIHNKFVKEALDRIGVISVYESGLSRMQLLETIDEGVVVFSAHGIAQEVVDRAIEKGLTVYNATCRDVIKTQDIVKDYLAQNYKVLYIGKENHPEADAMLSIDKANIKLISKLSDLDNLEIDDKTIVTNQTTMSIYDTKEVMDTIVKINPKVTIVNEICTATQIRQEALLNLDDYDLVYVVGDHLSNNTNNLKKIASRSVSKVRLVESVMDIDDNDLKDINKVGVTAGASTPTYLTQQVITYLEKYPNVSDADKTIDFSKVL